MTVRDLLNNIDSAELSEWYILEDFDAWKKKLAEKEARNPSAATVIGTLFGDKAKDATWLPPSKPSS